MRLSGSRFPPLVDQVVLQVPGDHSFRAFFVHRDAPDIRIGKLSRSTESFVCRAHEAFVQVMISCKAFAGSGHFLLPVMLHSTQGDADAP